MQSKENVAIIENQEEKEGKGRMGKINWTVSVFKQCGCIQIVPANVKSMHQTLPLGSFRKYQKFVQERFPSLHVPNREAIFPLGRAPLLSILFVLIPLLRPMSERKRKTKTRKKKRVVEMHFAIQMRFTFSSIRCVYLHRTISS